ncbi:jg25892, partial [Pararge aegeria aegeria]
MRICARIQYSVVQVEEKSEIKKGIREKILQYFKGGASQKE